MEVTYKAIMSNQVHNVVGSMQPFPMLEDQATCCEDMKAAINERPSQIGFDVSKSHTGDRFDWGLTAFFRGWGEEGDEVHIDFCPFCGQAITIKEVKRVRTIKREVVVPASTKTEYDEEEVKEGLEW